MSKFSLPVILTIAALNTAYAATPASTSTNSTSTHTNTTTTKNYTSSSRIVDLPEIPGIYSPTNDLYHEGFLTYLGGTPVLSSPYLGINSQLDGSDLIVNYPTIGEDIRILQQRRKLENTLLNQGDPFPSAPLIDIGGAIFTQMSIADPYEGENAWNFNLVRAQLNPVIEVNHWFTGMMVIGFDSSSSGPNQIGQSDLFLDRGLFTVGNLEESPYYATFGQYYVRFGRYSSFMLTPTLTRDVGRIKARAATLGYEGSQGLSAAAYVFPSDTTKSVGQNNRTTAGADLNYTFNFSDVSANVGISAVSNIADADSLQSTGAVNTIVPIPGYQLDDDGVQTFVGFGLNDSTEAIHHRVPGIDIRGKFNYAGKISGIAEYVTGTRDFDGRDLSYNGHAANPGSFNVELGYHFYIFNDKPTTWAVGYQETFNAYALDLPKRRLVTAVTTNLVKDTIAGIELHYDKAYSANDTGTGINGSPVVLTTTPGSSQTELAVLLGINF